MIAVIIAAPYILETVVERLRGSSDEEEPEESADESSN